MLVENTLHYGYLQMITSFTEINSMEKGIIIEDDRCAYECLKDVIDMHIHIGPDAVRKRRVDAIDAANKAKFYNMKGIVVKNKQFHTFVACMPAHDRLDPQRILEAIQEIGAEKTILSSDFGHDHNPPPFEGMRMAIHTLKRLGISQKEMDFMTKLNPGRLLDI